MKLYGFPASPNTWKVRAVAKHIGVPLEEEFVDLTKGVSHTPDYLALNPTGRTPALVDGDFVLWESTPIMQYIASVKPNTLWPDNARARADIVRWQSWDLAHFSGQGCQPLTFENLVKQIVNMGEPNKAVVDAALASFHREAKVLDQYLSKHRWLVGDQPTLADFSVGAPLFYADRAGLPLTDYPRVGEWFGRVSSLPGWKETAPQFAKAAWDLVSRTRRSTKP